MSAIEPPIVPNRIGVVEDHLEYAFHALRSYFEPHPDLTLVAGAETVPELLAITSDLDLVILDLLLDVPGGSTPTKNVRVLNAAGIKNILVHTVRDKPYLVQEAGRAGVLGVIAKSDPPEVLIEAIRLAVAGKPAPSLDWAAALDRDDRLIPCLTDREKEVLAKYASGETAKDIASQMHLSPWTIQKCVMAIKEKYTEIGREMHTKGQMRAAARCDGFLHP